MYKLIQGTKHRGYAQGYGLPDSGAHEEVVVPIAMGRPVDKDGVPLKPDDRLMTLGDTRCESFMDGALLVVVE